MSIRVRLCAILDKGSTFTGFGAETSQMALNSHAVCLLAMDGEFALKMPDVI
jgi:hypothetical protein